MSIDVSELRSSTIITEHGGKLVGVVFSEQGAYALFSHVPPAMMQSIVCVQPPRSLICTNMDEAVTFFREDES